MKHLKKLYLNAVIKTMPFPAALGWNITLLGDYLLESAGRIAMNALRGLGRLEGGR